MNLEAIRSFVTALSVVALGGCGSGMTDTSSNVPEIRQDYVRMSGTVYRALLVREFRPDVYSGPVQGAVVSTSLDSITATTDASGNYSLITQTLRQACQPFTVTIRAAGFPTYSDEGTWASTGQLFAFSPPTPSPDATDSTCR